MARDLKNLLSKLAVENPNIYSANVLSGIKDGTIYDVDIIFTLKSGEKKLVFVTENDTDIVSGYTIGDSGKRKNLIEIKFSDIKKAEFKSNSDAERFEMN